MTPEWQRLLRKHQNKTLGEFCRRPKIDYQLPGIVADFSETLILLKRFDFDTFQFNGYSVLRNDDVDQYRFFSRATDWRRRALKNMRVAIDRAPQLDLENLEACIVSIARLFPLLTIHMEIRKPDVCYIGYPLKFTAKELLLNDLDCNCEWQKPRRIKLEHITRIDFDGGYERALALTAPQNAKRP